jgi:transposase-like protein
MSQLFFRAVGTLSLSSISRMSDAEAEAIFCRLRWPETDGKPTCPHCGQVDVYDCRRLNGAPRFRCRACRSDFTLTSGTIFASHKLPLRVYLAAIAMYATHAEGKTAVAISRELGTSYKATLILLRKLHEAVREEQQ